MADKKITELDATTSLISGDLIPVVTSASLTAVTMKTTMQSIIETIGSSISGFEYVDQSGGTSDTYGILGGGITGSNVAFTVSQGTYTSGTLKVYLNGQLLTQGSSEDWVETSASAGVFSFASAPQVGDEITALYGKVGTAAAPKDAQYVTLAASSGLSAERVLTEGAGIRINDGTTIATIMGLMGYPCQGRLTLTSNTPVTTSDVTSASIVYFTPYKGNHICLYDGSKWNSYTFTEKELNASGFTGSSVYDVFAYNSGGSPVLEGVVWGSGSARATNLAFQDGVYVKSGSATRRYIGTIYTSDTGKIDDSLIKRTVWNYYNRVERRFLVRDTTEGWTYNSNTWRQANNATGNKVESVIGVVEDVLWLEYANRCICNNTSGLSGIGINKTNGNDCDVMGYYRGNQSTARGKLTLYPAVGYSYYAAVERTESGLVEFQSNASVGYCAGLTGSQMG